LGVGQVKKGAPFSKTQCRLVLKKQGRKIRGTGRNPGGDASFQYLLRKSVLLGG